MKGRPLRGGDTGAGDDRGHDVLASMKGRPLRGGDVLQQTFLGSRAEVLPR